MKIKLLLTLLISVIIATSSINSIGITAWGGYNISTESGVDCDAIKLQYTSASCTNGGLSLGADIWMFGLGPVQLGLGGGYVSLANYKYEEKINVGQPTESLSTGSLNAEVITVLAKVEAEVVGFVLGAGAGLGLYSVNLKSDSGNGSKVDVTASTTAPAIELMAGYNIGLGPVGIVPHVRALILMPSSSTSGSVSTSSKTLTNVIPGVAVSIKF